jgi:hypothetical protein
MKDVISYIVNKLLKVNLKDCWYFIRKYRGVDNNIKWKDSKKLFLTYIGILFLIFYFISFIQTRNMNDILSYKKVMSNEIDSVNYNVIIDNIQISKDSMIVLLNTLSNPDKLDSINRHHGENPNLIKKHFDKKIVSFVVKGGINKSFVFNYNQTLWYLTIILFLPLMGLLLFLFGLCKKISYPASLFCIIDFLFIMTLSFIFWIMTDPTFSTADDFIDLIIPLEGIMYIVAYRLFMKRFQYNTLINLICALAFCVLFTSLFSYLLVFNLMVTIFIIT